MPLELITGPVNSGKAGLVLEAVEEAAAGGLDPTLVVPTAADSDLLRRELAGRGVTAAVKVAGFRGLWEQMARRLDFDPRPLARFRLERIARVVTDEALDAGRLRSSLRLSATEEGFAPALVVFADELGEAGAGPDRFDAVMEAWAGAEPSLEPYATDLATLYRSYRERLETFGARDEASFVGELVEALAAEPGAWGQAPVFLYGFDDFSARQLATIEALAGAAGAAVTVSFPFEERAAFEARSPVYRRLEDLADGAVRRCDRGSAHYAPGSAGPLGGLEEQLFELDALPVDPGEAVERYVGGSERAELELVAARVAALTGSGGIAPEDVAVAIRDIDEDTVPLIEAVFAEAGVSIALRQRVVIGRTALVRGVLALMRCALAPDPSSPESRELVAELVTWLRTPGVSGPEFLWQADALERALRQGSVESLRQGEEQWSRISGLDSITALEVLRDGFADSQAEGFRRCAAQARRILATAAGEGQAPVLSSAQLRNAEALADLLVGFEDLEWLLARSLDLAPTPAQAVAELAAREIEVGESLVPGAVSVARPLALRARRVDTLVVARMQESQYPSRGRESAFLGDLTRARVDAAAAKAGLDPLWPDGQPDRVAAERHLLHALLSRAERMLAWSHYRMTDAGEPANPSLFLDDIEDLFDPGPDLLVRRLGETGWDEDPRLAPSGFQLELAGLSPREGREESYRLTTPAAVEGLAGRGVWSATSLELYLRCPVSWFVERFIRPETLEPDSESLRFGDAAHRVLKAVFESLPEGDRRLTPDNVDAALAVLDETVEGIELLSPDPVQERIMRRRMSRMLSGFLLQESGSGSQFVPAEFEMEFGSGGSAPADLGDGLVLRGQIDRVDRDGADAIVLDYKSGSTSQDWPAAKWLERGVLQAALYALVYEQERAGERVVGSMYASLRADSKGPRGAIETEADMERTDITGTDRKSGDEFRELLEEARELAAGAVASIGEGELSPTDTPERCAFTRDGGCAHPEICRRYR